MEKPSLRENQNSTTWQERAKEISYREFVEGLEKSDSKEAFSEKGKQKKEEIVFDYGLSEKRGKNYLDHPLLEEEGRFPPFLREFRKLNSIYPNFQHPSFKNTQIEPDLRKLLESLSKAT